MTVTLPVPGPFKVNAFKGLKGRISHPELQRAGFNPQKTADRGETISEENNVFN